MRPARCCSASVLRLCWAASCSLPSDAASVSASASRLRRHKPWDKIRSSPFGRATPFRSRQLHCRRFLQHLPQCVEQLSTFTERQSAILPVWLPEMSHSPLLNAADKRQKRPLVSLIFTTMQRLLLPFPRPLADFSSASAQCGSGNTAFQDGETLNYDLYYNWAFVWVKVGQAQWNIRKTTFEGKTGLPHLSDRIDQQTRGQGLYRHARHPHRKLHGYERDSSLLYEAGARRQVFSLRHGALQLSQRQNVA